MRTIDINIPGQSTHFEERVRHRPWLRRQCWAEPDAASPSLPLAPPMTPASPSTTPRVPMDTVPAKACSENSLAQAAASSVVLCTKFGILPGNPGGWKNKVKPLARAVLSVVPQLRGMVRKHAADQFVPGQFSVATLRSSFETSLRELKTDYVDILLMHGPPASVLQDEDMLEELRRLVDTGKVRVAGVSAEGEVIRTVFGKHSPVLQAAQFPMNPFSMDLASLTPTPQSR